FVSVANPAGGAGTVDSMFATRMLNAADYPRWLEPIPFRVPAMVRVSGVTIFLFKVVSEQRDGRNALWAGGTAQAARGAGDACESTFRRAIALAPDADRGRLLQMAGSAAYQWGASRTALKLNESAYEKTKAPAVLGSIAWILATTEDRSVRDGA